MRKLIQQIAKFGAVGATAFCIDYGLLVILTELFGLDYLLSATVSFCVSVAFNYLASMRFVFVHKEELKRHHEFIIFLVLSVIGLAINDLAMWVGTGFLLVDYRITKIVATAIVMIFNFITRKIFLDASK